MHSCLRNGSLSLLFFPISQHSKNILASPGQYASISITSNEPRADRPRVSLIGNLTLFPNVADTPDRKAIHACYVEKHPDARWWAPGDEQKGHMVCGSI
jgi:hypothetical protein